MKQFIENHQKCNEHSVKNKITSRTVKNNNLWSIKIHTLKCLVQWLLMIKLKIKSIGLFRCNVVKSKFLNGFDGFKEWRYWSHRHLQFDIYAKFNRIHYICHENLRLCPHQVKPQFDKYELNVVYTFNEMYKNELHNIQKNGKNESVEKEGKIQLHYVIRY